MSYLFCNFNPVIRNVEKWSTPQKWSVWTPQDFYSMFGHFSTCMKRLRHFQVQTSTFNLRDFEEKKKKSLHVVLSFHSLQIWLRFKKEFRFHKLKNTEILSSLLKARMQCFSKKFRQKKFFFFWYSYSFWKHLSRENLVVLKLLLEVPKFRENFVICVITVIKVHDILPTILLVITIHSFKNAWTQVIFILPDIIRFPLRFA